MRLFNLAFIGVLGMVEITVITFKGIMKTVALIDKYFSNLIRALEEKYFIRLLSKPLSKRQGRRKNERETGVYIEVNEDFERFFS